MVFICAIYFYADKIFGLSMSQYFIQIVLFKLLCSNCTDLMIGGAKNSCYLGNFIKIGA